MRQCLVIGRPNVGKTLLSLRLVEESGRRSALAIEELPTGETRECAMAFTNAVQTLVDAKPHTTLGTQTLSLAMGRVIPYSCVLVDSTGLESAHVEDRMVRLGMARTLQKLAECDMLLHVIDGTKLNSAGILSEADDLIRACAQAREIAYFLVINKIDLPGVASRAKKFERRQKKVAVHLVSALYKEGTAKLLRAMGKVNMLH